ncbi:MAG: MerR family transcriptional regulator [Desulfobacterales bacterium]|nr:MerR family transcriptional regulator [Desulfobacterales bacterium]
MEDRERNLYSIGQMAKICQIPIQTLRYYDKIGLLKPTIIKDENNYRYYSKRQILHVNLIKYLKSFEFSLDEIRELIKREDSGIILRFLVAKKAKVQEQIKSLQQIEVQLASQIENLKLLNDCEDEPYIEFKNIPERKIAYIRYNSPCNPVAISERYNELVNMVKKNQWQFSISLIAIFHDDYKQFDYTDADVEVCALIVGELQEHENIRSLPAGQYVTILHRGPYTSSWKSYQLLLDWCKQNGYEIIGPAIEIYIIGVEVTNDPEDYITELQLPVKKL